MQRLPLRGEDSTPAATPSLKEPTGRQAIALGVASLPPGEQASTLDHTTSVKITPDNDIFEGPDTENSEDLKHVEPVPQDDNLLPVEIQSLMDRFIESLQSKTHAAPLSIDQVSELYQNFYAHAESIIGTHIAALASRLSREKSPAPSTSSVASIKARQARKSPKSPEIVTEEPLSQFPLISTDELSEKRKARKQLELKRLALEEAVERGVCEKVYSKIWRHRSTDDEERDEKVRSRAAALQLVGVDLNELLSTTKDQDPKPQASASPDDAKTEIPAKARLASARQHLARMNHERCPLGKLQALTATHKSVVETLSEMFPSSSSADEILPTLIYTIITSSPDDISVVSNINFIQRFRWSSKVDGEAAYCLTNLEAAISFLETVDLSAIRANEAKAGPAKSTSQPSTPRSEAPDPLYRGLPGSSSERESATAERPALPPSSSASRRLSSLLQSRPRPLDAASGVISQGTEVAYDTIHNALDGSFRFFFGRLKEQQSSQSANSPQDIAIPKTLEDARKLVGTPPPAGDDDASLGLDGEKENDTGKDSSKKSPAPSIRSARSGSNSSRKVTFTQTPAQTTAANAPVAQVGSLGAVESMRSLGNSLNPLKGFSGMGMMRGFGRPQSPSAAVSPGAGERANLDLGGIAPPIQRFVTLKEARELNGFDVELLLRDYQRIAGALAALQTRGDN